jgi:hypothetical protein
MNSRDSVMTVPETKFNGLFAMTPDNLPLAGSVPSRKSLYLSAAVWVTHAAGVARFVADLVVGGEMGLDRATRLSLDPMRFKGRSVEDLHEEALRGYSDIYRTDRAALRMSLFQGCMYQWEKSGWTPFFSFWN